MPKPRKPPAGKLKKLSRLVRICVDFSSYPDNTQLGPTYTQAGFVFKQLAPTPVMFANATSGHIGLQFPDSGLAIRLPAATGHVGMLLGTFGGPVSLVAYSGNTAVATQTINTNNSYANVVVSAANPVSRVVFKGGHNETILVRICADYKLC